MHFVVSVRTSSAVRPWSKALESVISVAERGASPFCVVIVGEREEGGRLVGRFRCLLALSYRR